MSLLWWSDPTLRLIPAYILTQRGNTCITRCVEDKKREQTSYDLTPKFVSTGKRMQNENRKIDRSSQVLKDQLDEFWFFVKFLELGFILITTKNDKSNSNKN